MERLVVNVQTGEQTTIPFTPEEEAEALAIGAAEEARIAAEEAARPKPTLEQLQAQLALIQSQLAELATP